MAISLKREYDVLSDDTITTLTSAELNHVNLSDSSSIRIGSDFEISGASLKRALLALEAIITTDYPERLF